jgi:hypothetical protein
MPTNMIVRTNMAVKTPLGKGVVQGRWSALEWLIRIPIDDVTRSVLDLSVTPRATISGLWIFTQAEISQ